jgi:hypothetical protein
MAVIRPLKKFFLHMDQQQQQDYIVLDLCAGNGLTGLIVVHLFRCRVMCVDIKLPKKLHFSSVQRFSFVLRDVNTINETYLSNIGDKIIFISSHPCQNALTIVKLAKLCNVKFSILPCCIGSYSELPIQPRLCNQKLSKYEQWCLGLAQYGNANAYIDKNCLSSANIVVTNL